MTKARIPMVLLAMGFALAVSYAADAQTPATLIEHNYGGTRIVECSLVTLDYQSAGVLIELACDGIFRGGFE